MYLLLSTLFEDFTDGKDSIATIEIRVRLFLSAFDRLDQSTKLSRQALPRWVETYNYMCLLNIPDIVRKFGPYKNLYEGKFCGESFNRILKPIANRGAHRNRCFNVLRNIHREKAMSAVQQDFDNGDVSLDVPFPNNCEVTRSPIYRLAHRYGKKLVISSDYHKNLPLSTVIYKEKDDNTNTRCYGICFLFKARQILCPIVRNLETEVVIGLHMKYWYWELRTEVQYSRKLEAVDVVDYGLLLPLLCDPNCLGETLPANYYTITTYVWNAEKAVMY